MPTDGATAKFLYTILKQLDLKSIDWQTVATALEITNGHAARMRFSRFKQAMEGVAPAPRRRTTTTPRPRKPKTSKESSSKKRGIDEVTKTDDDEPAATRVKKEEPVEEAGNGFGTQGVGDSAGGVEVGCGAAEQMGNLSLGQTEVPMQGTGMGEGMGAIGGAFYTPGEVGVVKKEPLVKVEPVPGWDD
ncbi:MAG: hypothetical protein M1835_007420 [Candelina submexicana]|nr:MAG: hypothetical protein M1835_007420 [Candelina submexicana]